MEKNKKSRDKSKRWGVGDRNVNKNVLRRTSRRTVFVKKHRSR